MEFCFLGHIGFVNHVRSYTIAFCIFFAELLDGSHLVHFFQKRGMERWYVH